MKLVKFAAICAAAVSVSAIADDVSNTIAILPVAKALTVMPLTSNFLDANGNSLTADKVVKTAGLPGDSELYVYNKTSGEYSKYTIDNNAWVLANDGTTYKVDAGGTMSSGQGSTADNLAVPRGTAVFLKTTNSSATFYLAGMPCESNTVTTVTAGANLIGAPKAAAFDMNGSGVVYGGAGIANSAFVTNPNDSTDVRLQSTGDVIEIANTDGGDNTRYYYNGTKWGKLTTTGSGFTKKSQFVEGCTIPVGQGFWYIRKAGTDPLTITW